MTKQYIENNYFYYYKFNKLNKKFVNELKIIFKNNDIDKLSLSKAKYEEIIEKHTKNPKIKKLYKFMHSQLVWFINKGYVKKGFKIEIKEQDINLIIDTAIKCHEKWIYRVRIPIMLKQNTIIIKSFYIKK